METKLHEKLRPSAIQNQRSGSPYKPPSGCRGSAFRLRILFVRICSHVLSAAEGWASLCFPRPLQTLNKHRTPLSIQVGKSCFLRRSEAKNRSPPA